MSLHDPSKRIWNRYPVRRSLVWICWTLSAAGAFAGGAGLTVPGGWPEVVWIVAFLLALGGGFLNTFGLPPEPFDVRPTFTPIGVLFLATGLGALVGALVTGDAPDDYAEFALYAIVTGGVIIVAMQIVAMVVARRRRIRARARVGIAITGVVTRAHSYVMNYQAVTRVTVRFTDRDGRVRWAGQTVSGNVDVGRTLTIRYSAQDLGRRGGVIIDG
jgi:hypothetical protein